MGTVKKFEINELLMDAIGNVLTTFTFYQVKLFVFKQ